MKTAGEQKISLVASILILEVLIHPAQRASASAKNDPRVKHRLFTG